MGEGEVEETRDRGRVRAVRASAGSAGFGLLFGCRLGRFRPTESEARRERPWNSEQTSAHNPPPNFHHPPAHPSTHPTHPSFPSPIIPCPDMPYVEIPPSPTAAADTEPLKVKYYCSTPTNAEATEIDPSLPTLVFLHPIYFFSRSAQHPYLPSPAPCLLARAQVDA